MFLKPWAEENSGRLPLPDEFQAILPQASSDRGVRCDQELGIFIGKDSDDGPTGSVTCNVPTAPKLQKVAGKNACNKGFNALGVRRLEFHRKRIALIVRSTNRFSLHRDFSHLSVLLLARFIILTA